MNRSFHLSLAKQYWKAHLRPGDSAIDATCGNGHDTLFLSKLLLDHPESSIVAMDIQLKAIKNTEQRLEDNLPKKHLDRIFLRHDSHENLANLPVRPRLIVYNLGYLPGGDKQITTSLNSTLESIKQGLKILAEDGALSITCYPGHEEGAREEAALIAFASALSSKDFFVCHHRFLNRIQSPSLIWILKLLNKTF